MSKRTRSETDEDLVAVRLPVWRGALRCGTYQAGQIYRVTPEEADRLVRAKGFEVVGDEPGDR